MDTAFELLCLFAVFLVGAVVAGYIVAGLGWIDNLTDEDRLDHAENCEVCRGRCGGGRC